MSKLQVGQIILNRTKKYLAPCIRTYGPEFENCINSMIKVGMGIGDIITVKSGVHFEKHLFILVDTTSVLQPFKFNSRIFSRQMKWLREQPMYEDDYVFDDVQAGNLHMVVVKFPEKYYKAYETFKASQFSKMFTMEDVHRFFGKKPEIQRVLVKDHSYKIEFVKSLNDMFDTRVRPEEFEGELDFPIRKEEETFNNHLLNRGKGD